MNSTIIPSLEQIHLSGISWQTYETLLRELEHRHLRLTYNHGNLEIMSPSPEHERYKETLGRFVENIAEEMNIIIEPFGSTTLKIKEQIGAEPDKCFYISNLGQIIQKKRLDLTKDPPPDLVIEIDITSSSENRLSVYASLNIPEIWVY
ncbi:MAG TPA: Uma2 family endonuclease, partial [Allocoleopsis sp.]